MDKSKYLGIKESFLLVFLYSFLLKKIIIFLLSSIFYLLTKEGYWTFIIVGTCIGILSWAAAIYCTNQYMDHRKWYDTSNAYKIQLKPLFIGLMAVVMIYINRNAMMSFLNGIVTGEWQFTAHCRAITKPNSANRGSGYHGDCDSKNNSIS